MECPDYVLNCQDSTSSCKNEKLKYGLSILGIKETSWTGASRLRLAFGEMLLYSGQEKDNVPHTLRVSMTAQRVLLPQNPPADNDLPTKCNICTKEKIRKTIQILKNVTAVGPDSAPAEVLKTDVEGVVDILLSLFAEVWEKERVFKLFQLPKKGDLSLCSNYRGITLLSVLNTMFNGVLLERMKMDIHEQRRDQQADFHKDKSCSDQISTLRTLLKQSLECNSSLYVNFINYKEAFDSVDRTTLEKPMRHYRLSSPTSVEILIKEWPAGLYTMASLRRPLR
ncbi:endonuclease-reverse transcriptase [Elysia marginata]|uniref:Endonuclease-reverse transcriptase n=1 Tax=Elysia marginata TaxID=1093978 RepID=A0AAV4JXZ0_9GAST|nr:endonuclease-reverse transcriptase [Elysia marginata]